MPPLPKVGMAELSEAGGIRSRRFRTFDNYKLQITNYKLGAAPADESTNNSATPPF